MFGQAEYAGQNARFNALVESRPGPLVAAHRGAIGGIVYDNTEAAVRTAVASGADVVEIDVIASTDGDFFVFHDGYEHVHFGLGRSILGLTTAEMRELRYRHHPSDDTSEPLAPLDDLLLAFPDVVFNVDRSWRWWDTLLPFLDRLAIPDRIILKSAAEPRYLAQLESHAVKYPFIPMVSSPDDVERVAGLGGVNTIGVELLAADATHPFVRPEYFSALRERGLAPMVNAINLGNRQPLFAGMDDLTSILEDPAEGWGALLAFGPAVIQTDFPALLDAFIRQQYAGGARLPDLVGPGA